VCFVACFISLLQIASTAKSKGMGPLLGVIYDDIVRKQWEDLSMKLGSSWSVGDFMKAPQEDALRRAEVLYKSIFVANKACLCASMCMRAAWINFLLLQGEGVSQSSGGNGGNWNSKGSGKRQWSAEVPKDNKKAAAFSGMTHSVCFNLSVCTSGKGHG
jgi:hypothetical protein